MPKAKDVKVGPERGFRNSLINQSNRNQSPVGAVQPSEFVNLSALRKAELLDSTHKATQGIKKMEQVLLELSEKGKDLDAKYFKKFGRHLSIKKCTELVTLSIIAHLRPEQWESAKQDVVFEYEPEYECCKDLLMTIDDEFIVAVKAIKLTTSHFTPESLNELKHWLYYRGE